MKFTQITTNEYTTEFLNLNSNASIQVGWYGDFDDNIDNQRVEVEMLSDSTYRAFMTKYSIDRWVQVTPKVFGNTVEIAIDDLISKYNG